MDFVFPPSSTSRAQYQILKLILTVSLSVVSACYLKEAKGYGGEEGNLLVRVIWWRRGLGIE
jgi:hypothetical protein